jgi:hypothetical protein
MVPVLDSKLSQYFFLPYTFILRYYAASYFEAPPQRNESLSEDQIDTAGDFLDDTFPGR